MGYRLLLSALLFCTSLVMAEEIKASGATTVQPIVVAAGKAFKETHPKVDFIVGAGGSDKGVENVAAGNVELGMVGRAMKDAELEKNKDLVPVTIGYDGIGIVVSNKVTIDKITKQQVQDIYSGKISNWKDIGGPDAAISLNSRTKGHAQLDLFLSHFGLEAQFGDAAEEPIAHKKKGDEAFAKIKARPAVNNEKMMEAVLTNQNSIGYLPIGFAQARAEKGAPIKLLELDGVAANVANVGNASYPQRRPLLVVTKGPAQGVVKEFIDFLVGETGQKLVAQFEYIPLKAAEAKKPE
jgi:phosphate transport system substrate-binding protein